MRYFYFILALLLSNSVFSQCNGRYQTEIFSSVSITEVNYSDVYNDTEHLMDIYTPDGDTEINRPLIIFAHGGSFMGGHKNLPDCIDFCNSFAKKGYVTASVNYRIVPPANQQNFILYQEDQYEAILKAVADIKSAIRYFRKDFTTNNNYGIDTNTIFIGGSSAGAVAMLHLAYIDSISDLPSSVTYLDFLSGQPITFNPQNIITTIGGNLEGDAGNDGYSSKVSGVISFAGGIHNVNWIDASDEPLVSIQGDADQTVSYNCSYGMAVPTIVELCGSGEMHPQANSVNIIHDHLLLNGADHSWFDSGNNDSRFIQALNFTSSFLYPLLPCNQTNTINENYNSNKTLVKSINLLGKNISKNNKHQILLYFYNDGSVEKKMILN